MGVEPATAPPGRPEEAMSAPAVASGLPSARERPFSWPVVALKVALAAAILAALAAGGRVDLAALERGLAAPASLGAAFAILGAHYALASARWWLLVRAQDVPMPYLAAVKLTLVGMFFNTFLPGAIGGDPVKIYYVARHAPPGKRLEAGTSVLFDRVLGLASLVAMAIAAFAVATALGADRAFLGDLGRAVRARFGPLVPLLALAGACVALATAAALAVAMSKRARAAAGRLPGAAVGARIGAALGRAALCPRLVGAAFFVSCAAHAFTVLAFLVIGRAIGNSPSAARTFTLVPIGLVAHAVPGPPAGLGVGEAVFEALFAIGARGPSLGAEICAIWHILTLAWNQIGGIAYILDRRAGSAVPELIGSGSDAP